jgi:hypothetical protein
MAGFFVPAGFELVTLTSLSSLTTNSNTDYPTPQGQKILKDMDVGFDPLMCARVTIPFNIVSLGETTRWTTTSRCPHGFKLGPHWN